MKSNKKFAIITVSYNSESSIKQTIMSVLKQNYTNFEYFVKDGGSSDGTFEIVKEYGNEFMERGISYSFISEKDKGIFPAMNEALEHISAEYVLFLNAGDYLFDSNVLERIDSELKNHDYDIIYGNYWLYSENKRKHIISKDFSLLPKCMITTHQAIFTKTELLKKRPYSNDYRMTADYDFYLDMFLQNKKFLHINQDFVYFAVDGVSQKNAIRTQNEVFDLKMKHGCITVKQYKLRYFKIYKTVLQKMLLGRLPKCIRFKDYEEF